MCHHFGVFILFILVLIVIVIMERSPFTFADPLYEFENKFQCPDVHAMKHFNIFAMLGPWYVAQYYSSSEEALTYTCMYVEFGLSSGNMDMRMKLTFRYANDPNEEIQTGNMTWQIPDPRRPEHWRHSEDHYKGVYNTDVIDTDYENWLLLLHCSDPESDKKFLSSFVLSRTPYLDKMTTDYLREKIGYYSVELDYLFPVNQTHCFDPIMEKKNDDLKPMAGNNNLL